MSFFYIAIKQRYTTLGCPAGGCLAFLRKQLIIVQVVLSLSRIAEIIAYSLWVRYTLWRELKQLQKDRRESGMMGEEEEIENVRCYAEEQGKYAKFGLREQISGMNQCVISLGFVILFGAIAPIMVPFSLAVFMVQLR